MPPPLCLSEDGLEWTKVLVLRIASWRAGLIEQPLQESLTR
jgi:hypothetical protein